jgi:CHRD domain-containing protein
MRKVLLACAVVALVPLVATVHAAAGDDVDFRARLTGFQEVPAISTAGHGDLKLDVGNGTIEYWLTYSNMSSKVLFAHIHFGRFATNGGVSAFLCGGGTAPACPARGGTVHGTIRVSDVVGPPEQGIDARQLGEVLRAMRFGATYSNVHTELFQSGEIRGQIIDD